LNLKNPLTVECFRPEVNALILIKKRNNSVEISKLRDMLAIPKGKTERSYYFYRHSFDDCCKFCKCFV